MHVQTEHYDEIVWITKHGTILGLIYTLETTDYIRDVQYNIVAFDLRRISRLEHRQRRGLTS